MELNVEALFTIGKVNRNGHIYDPESFKHCALEAVKNEVPVYMGKTGNDFLKETIGHVGGVQDLEIGQVPIFSIFITEDVYNRLTSPSQIKFGFSTRSIVSDDVPNIDGTMSLVETKSLVIVPYNSEEEFK